MSENRILMSKALKDPNFFASHELVESVDANDQPKYGERTLTIRSVELEEITDMELIKSKKKNSTGTQTKLAHVLHFVEQNKPYVIKASCVIDAIEKATGTKVVNRWIGKRITFYVEKDVKAFGKTTDALRVRPYAPVVAKTYVCADCGCLDVPEKVAVYAQKLYDVVTCAACGAKRKAAQETTQEQENPVSDDTSTEINDQQEGVKND